MIWLGAAVTGPKALPQSCGSQRVKKNQQPYRAEATCRPSHGQVSEGAIDHCDWWTLAVVT